MQCRLGVKHEGVAEQLQLLGAGIPRQRGVKEYNNYGSFREVSVAVPRGGCLLQPAAGPSRCKEYQLALEAAAAAASAGAEAGSLGVLALVCACVRQRLVTVSPPLGGVVEVW